MSDVKLVLTDFDGTVAQMGKHIVSERVREAVIACENKGVRMVPITGRYYAMARPVLEVLGFEDLGIFDNGASIMNCKTGELVWSQWMEPETIRQVAKILAPAALIIDYTEDHEEHEPADNELERIELVDSPASHVYALLPVKDMEVATAQLAKILGITFYTAISSKANSSGCLGIQVNHEKADKFHGAAALREMLGIPKEHTLAIGDGDNDVPLFNNAKYKIAMGNATDLLKDRADHVVASVDDDGFAEAMERFVLN
ncbi:MAG: HAD-IIB family hydrolase [Candidatus Saccharimonadales bacterium]